MDMSVTISPNKDAEAGSPVAQPPRAANASDLDLWLEKVEALGELKRITAEVDPDLEAATITYLVGSSKSPALLFENIKGHPGHKALYNMIGCNLSRFCLMIGEEPVDHPLKAVQALQRKFGRALQDRNALGFGFDADFQVESYLRYQGSSFVDRFDANSYLYITRAMDYFDLAGAHGGVLATAFRGTPTRYCLMSFTSDWLFPTRESREIVHALNAAAANVSFVEVESDKGHDAFLLEEPEMFRTLAGFLKGAGPVRGLKDAS